MIRREKRERVSNRLYSSKSYRVVKGWKRKMPRMVISLSIPADQRHLWEAVERYAKMERTTPSEIIRRAIREYIKRHGEGNPNRPLFPRHPIYKNPPLERVKTLLEELEDLIKANPGRSIEWITNIFRRQTGLRPKTTKQYLETLGALGLIRVRARKVYHRDLSS